MNDQGPTDEQEELQAASAAATSDTQSSPADGSRELEGGGSPARCRELCALEAVLFMAAEPLSRQEISEILQIAPAEADELIQALEADCAGRGIQVSRIAGGCQVTTRPEYGPYVARLHKPERFRLSRAALETLAIVAYRQPVTRPEVEAVRGVNSDSPLDTLLQYELVQEAGRKDAPGRPVLYRTTERFLGHFGLNSIADLPNLESIPAGDLLSEAAGPEADGSSRERAGEAPPYGGLAGCAAGETEQVAGAGGGGPALQPAREDHSGEPEEQSGG